MLKKRIILLFLLSSLMSFAQHQIKGTIEPFSKDIKWAMLYQIKEGKQHYIKNTKIDNKSFYFEIPQTSSSGMYRVVYRLKGEGFIDFLYNKEVVSFTFNPDYPEETVRYSKSKENQIYKAYLQSALNGQQYLDSIQITYFKDPSPVAAVLYQEAYYELKDIQKQYQKESKNMLAFHFIQATQRYNSKTIISSPQDYLEGIKNNFFQHINFDDSVLVNSSFLVDRAIDYIFNLNYSQDPKTQKNLYKESVKNMLTIPKNTDLQKDLTEIIIEEFVKLEDVEMVKYILENHYKQLPAEQQSNLYIEKTLAKISIVLGELAPDFTWGENKQLSTLQTHKNYIVVFWSTGCSHCKKQLPELYAFLKDYKDVQVINVALEENNKEWTKLIPNFEGWENVLGLGKWKNTIAKSYNVEFTPTYIVLNANKRIIVLPDNYKELKDAVSRLK
ncbi:TlpA disulfide reductase family protein [Flavicella sp.]|uniref:TlpA family protein disulfide reductase n=1 Tax=Flavicella sp. TaxID=2957742 RepID=UPI003015EB23